MQPARNHLFTLFLFLLFSVPVRIFAQQPAVNHPENKIQMPNTAGADYRSVYTFNILAGTNNSFGYNVLKNGILVLHQPAEVQSKQAISLRSAIQATRAAMFVIYKMKQNIQPAALSNDELKKVTIN